MIDGDADFVRARLSDREREVLVLYVSGLEISQIAQQLFVTENSTREYLRRIRAKYTEAERPASTKVDLLRRAIEDGIVPPDRAAVARPPPRSPAARYARAGCASRHVARRGRCRVRAAVAGAYGVSVVVRTSG